MNVVANVDTTPTNHKRSSDEWRMFDVPSDVFRRFENGRNKFERWSKFLDESDDNQKEILLYAKSNPKNTIVLRDETNGVLRQIRRNK